MENKGSWTMTKNFKRPKKTDLQFDRAVKRLCGCLGVGSNSKDQFKIVSDILLAAKNAHCKSWEECFGTVHYFCANMERFRSVNTVQKFGKSFSQIRRSYRQNIIGSENFRIRNSASYVLKVLGKIQFGEGLKLFIEVVEWYKALTRAFCEVDRTGIDEKYWGEFIRSMPASGNWPFLLTEEKFAAFYLGWILEQTAWKKWWNGQVYDLYRPDRNGFLTFLSMMKMQDCGRALTDNERAFFNRLANE